MKKKLLYYWMPEWIVSSIRKKKCSQCDEAFKKELITAIGLRKYKKTHQMFIEHACSSCGHKSVILVNKSNEDSIEKMCYSLLEGIKTKKISEKSSKLTNKPKGIMTEKEAKKMIDFIQKSAYYDDLLKAMGMLPKDEN